MVAQNPAGEVSAGVPSAIFPDYPAGQGGDGPATVVHHGRVRAVLEEELHHPQVATPTLCGPEEGGHPVHIPRPVVEVGLVEEESHHPLPATPGSLHQRGPALPVLGVGVQALGQQVLSAAQVALPARPEELGLAQGKWNNFGKRRLSTSDFKFTVFGFRSFLFDPPWPWVNCLRGENGRHNPAGEVSAGMHPWDCGVVEHLAAVEESAVQRAVGCSTTAMCIKCNKL